MEDEGAREEASDSECQATGRSCSCSQGHTEEEGGAYHGAKRIPGLTYKQTHQSLLLRSPYY